MKNENGGGSVYKLKGKRRKPWVAIVTLGYTPEGKQKRKLIGSTTTKREAQDLLYHYLRNPSIFSKKTFKEVREAWWSTYIKRITNNVTISTMEYRLRSLECLDNREMSTIKLNELQEIFNKMNFSWNFKKGCKSALNMIFDYALKNDLIESNKVHFIEIGKHDKHIERKIFTSEEIEILWNNIDMKHVYIILILIYTGMRIGELTNLKVDDINLSENLINIKESKTQAGIRKIPINPKILPLIINNINSSKEYFLSGQTTEKLSYATFKDRFIKILKTLNLQEHTIHDTRHTFASLMNNANANPTTIIRLMGHTKFKTTENIYTHKDKNELEKAIKLI